MSSYTLISGTAISRESPIAAVELAHACGADIDWVVQLVDVGIIQIETAAGAPHEWVFGSADLRTWNFPIGRCNQ